MRWRPIAMALAAAFVVLGGWWAYEQGAGPDGDARLPALVTGVVLLFVVPAIVGAWRRPEDRLPVVLLAAGLSIGASYFRALEPGGLAAVGAGVWFASPLLVLRVAVQQGRPERERRPRDWWPIGVLLAVALVVTSGPQHRQQGTFVRRAASWVFQRPPDSIVFLRQENPFAWWPSDRAVLALWIVWGIWIAVVTVRTTARARRGRTVLVPVAVTTLASIVLAIPDRLTPFADGSHVVGHWYSELLLALPAIGAAIVGGRAVWDELVVPRLSLSQSGAIQLDASTTPDALRGELARAVGDPTVRVAFPAPEGGWIDEGGHPIAIPTGPHRGATIVTRGDETIAAIDYDVSLLGQPDLVDVGATTIALSLDARRLAALAESAAEDARSSAARLLAAADEGRQQVEHQIDEGPEQRLARVTELLDARPIDLALVHQELKMALAEVRAIAHGATPPALHQDGLGAALDDLRGAAPVPLEVAVDAGRLPSAVEVTVYGVAADAVHRSLGPTAVWVTTSNGDVVLRIQGADAIGDQLLVDRVETLGGHVASDGNELVVTIPCVEG